MKKIKEVVKIKIEIKVLYFLLEKLKKGQKKFNF